MIVVAVDTTSNCVGGISENTVVMKLSDSKITISRYAERNLPVVTLKICIELFLLLLVVVINTE